MPDQGIKKKLLRFKSVVTSHWPVFMISNPCYDTDYYQAEIAKMFHCGSETNGFAVYQCLDCGKAEHKVNFCCKGKVCMQCGKHYARDSMVKNAARLYPGVGYRHVVLTLLEQLRTPFHNHPNQHGLYSRFMMLYQSH